MGCRCGPVVLLVLWAWAFAPFLAGPVLARELMQKSDAAIAALAPELKSPENEVGVVPPEAAEAPLATLGPLPAYEGQSLTITLDLWGPGLLTFNIRQQEILLAVLNETILDVEDDELQLLNVEDILPLSGPQAVSIYSGRNESIPPPAGSRRLLRVGRNILQSSAVLESAGSPVNISMLPHLQAVVRASVAPTEMQLLKDETRAAVAGPLLPMLNEEGIDVRYLTLTSLGQNYGSAGPPQPSGHSLNAGDISAIAVGSVAAPVAAIVGFLMFKRRQRQKRQAAVLGKDVASSGSDRSSVEGQPTSEDKSPASLDGLHAFMPERLAYSRSLTPLGSLVSSSDSRDAGQKDRIGNPMDPDLCTVPFGELQFSRVIGEGSFGRVFLGKWQETTVAIKILLTPGGGPLPDESWDIKDVSQLKDCSWSQEQASKTPAQKRIIEELGKEAGLMAKLRHPNTVMFLGASLDPPCMVTEFCARGSLLDVLHRARTNEVVRKQLDWRRRLRLALDAAKGMNYLHHRQPPIFHRDLKSANLLVDKHWQAKVADFNLSRVMHPTTAISSIAATNPRWLPPEVLAGKSYDSSTDVYAYGIILWELITWEIPWKEETPWQVVIAVVDHDQRPEIPSREEAPGGLPLAWEEYHALMLSCWAKDAQQRPSFDSVIMSMRALIDAEDANGSGALPQLPPVHVQAPEASVQIPGTIPSSQYVPRSSPFLNMPALPGLKAADVTESQHSIPNSKEHELSSVEKQNLDQESSER